MMMITVSSLWVPVTPSRKTRSITNEAIMITASNIYKTVEQTKVHIKNSSFSPDINSLTQLI